MSINQSINIPKTKKKHFMFIALINCTTHNYPIKFKLKRINEYRTAYVEFHVGPLQRQPRSPRPPPCRDVEGPWARSWSTPNHFSLLSWPCPRARPWPRSKALLLIGQRRWPRSEALLLIGRRRRPGSLRTQTSLVAAGTVSRWLRARLSAQPACR